MYSSSAIHLTGKRSMELSRGGEGGKPFLPYAMQGELSPGRRWLQMDIILNTGVSDVYRRIITRLV